MAAPEYRVLTGAAVQLSAATARSILGARAAADFILLCKEVSISFDGTSAAATPVLVELMLATFATKPPGTNSTSVTPVQTSGRTSAAGFTAAREWAAGNEPTVLTAVHEWLIHPQAGAMVQLPLGSEIDAALNEGFVLRCTAPATVNARAEFLVSRG